MRKASREIRVADEVWIATALLCREHPGAADFSVQEIVARVARETGDTRSSVYTHAANHCVANRKQSPARLRMLVETTRSRRRLFRPGDPYHPDRHDRRTVPDRARIPAKYRPLLDWYEREWAATVPKDLLLALAARHRDIWKTVDPDDYVRQLRGGFE